jgi:hypothetical protein
MANCDLCKQKLPFMGGESLLVGEKVQGVAVGKTYTLCANCMRQVNEAKQGDKAAKHELRLHIDEIISDSRERDDFYAYLKIPKEQAEIENLAKSAKEKMAQQESVIRYREAEVERVMAQIKEEQASSPAVFELYGCRGRSMKVYTDRVVITTSVSLGAILTNNATDGEKTVFYHDVVGIQYKEPGLTIGYLQLETASGQMNNRESNAFSENTYTFEKNTETMQIVKDYITWQVAQFKCK